MSRYTDPKGLMDLLLEVCVGFLTCVVALTIALYLLARIWLWLVLVALVLGGVWLLVRWLRYRRDDWW